MIEKNLVYLLKMRKMSQKFYILSKNR